MQSCCADHNCCKSPSEAAYFQKLRETIHSAILQADMHAYLGAALVGLLVDGTPYFLDIVLGALLQIAILELLYILLVTSSGTCGGVLNTMIQVRYIAVCNRHLATTGANARSLQQLQAVTCDAL